MGISQCKSRFITGSFLRTSIVLMLLSLLPMLGFAQNVNVKGVVYDETGAPAIGVNILKKGLRKGQRPTWMVSLSCP